MNSPAAAVPTRRLILLGSTGSIGTNVLNVVEHLHSLGTHRFQIVGLAAGANASLLLEQAHRFGVKTIALANGSDDQTLSEFEQVFRGDDAALQLVEAVAQPGDLLVGAMVGAAGLPATLAAIDRGCDIALANKETLVAAGEIVMPRVQSAGVNLLPIDSEHSAILQCLQSGRDISEVQRIVITASGGPFRTWSAARIARATVDEALNHPTWSMGRKITIDSATMMNKALEIIEAHWLFGLAAGKIDVIIHPQSLIHSFVEFVDGSVIAQLSPPDMRTPIQYALTWPHRAAGCSQAMDWASLRSMDFEQVDQAKFPAVGLAYDVIARGGTAGAILNAGNEAAVHAFLDGRIHFGRIVELVGEALRTVPIAKVTSLQDILRADAAARRAVADSLQPEVAAPQAAASRKSRIPGTETNVAESR